MPTWFIVLAVAGVVLGLIYCLATWDANRECRNCRVALFFVGEVTGAWLVFNGWREDGELQIALGTVILLTVNFYLGIRYLAQRLGQNNARQEPRSQSEDTALTMAATGTAAATITAAASSAGRDAGTDDDATPTSEGSDLDLDVDL
ncbi:hypothetical protein [Pelagibius sp. Alg239-R121]|uniref:hypothetical protein n=1 Tax=Pelagibius sp. Alg239-R121 TaxID=2993448 RepID=UPI0024A6D9FE|nr:hypothetical protein [Pelagibius sp. Alg239-R121]